MEFLPAVLTPNLFILFALILMAGLAAGGLAHRSGWVPSITAYMLVGMLIGPGGFGLLTPGMMESARIFIDIALALIMLDLGRHMEWGWLKSHPSMLRTSLMETILTLVLVTGGLVLMGMPTVPSLVVASIVLAASPAILLLVVREFNVEGPVTDRATVLVGLNNFASVLCFSVAMVLMYGTTGDTPSWLVGILHPVYLMVAGFTVAMIALAATELVTWLGTPGKATRYALLVATLMLAVGLSYLAKVPPLLTALFMGAISINLKHDTPLSEEPLGKASTLFFVIMFVLAGAKIKLVGLATVMPLALLVVVLRQVAKHGAIFAMARGMTTRQKAALGFTLMPMAGMAVGLVQTTDTYFPAIGGMLAGVVLGAVMVLETLGPIVTELALRWARELKGDAKVEH